MTIMDVSVPPKSLIERDLPVEELFELCIREGNRKRPVYQMHKWWSRRLGSVFRLALLASVLPEDSSARKLWSRFYSRNDLSGITVLDPFMGGGTSIVESRKCQARTIGVDIDPVAWFVTRKEIESCDIGLLEEAFERVRSSVASRIHRYYMTRGPDGDKAEVIYYFWVDLVTCQNCKHQFEAHPNYVLGYDTPSDTLHVFCRRCHSVAAVKPDASAHRCVECRVMTKLQDGTVRDGRYKCPHCLTEGRIIDTKSAKGPRPRRLFAVEYENAETGGRDYKRADKYDIALFASAEKEFRRIAKALPYPRERIPVRGRTDPRPVNHGYTHYRELFNARQLLSLSLILREIKTLKPVAVREALLLAFSDSLASNNMLCSYAYGYRKLTPLFNLHAYNMVTRPVENNVWGVAHGRGSFARSVAKVIAGKRNGEAPYEMKYPRGHLQVITTGERISASVTGDPDRFRSGRADALLVCRSSENLRFLHDNSVDVILTDPPYFDTIPYSELSDFFYVWLRRGLPSRRNWDGRSTPIGKALIASPRDPASVREFVTSLSRSFRECARVLKPGGLMVFTFHHRKPVAWHSLHSALLDTDFVVTNVLPVRSEGRSGFHSTEGTIKWDAVIVCRKGHRMNESFGFQKLWKWTDTRLQRWERRLKSHRFGFSWPDRISLGFAMALWRMSMSNMSEAEASSLLQETGHRLAGRVPRRSRHLVERDFAGLEPAESMDRPASR